MRDDICTIPVSEVFEPKEGCPICRMRDTIEERMLDYIMGAAMMEPDVRQETNRKGFCTDHLHRMMGRRGRLSLALMLDSRLQELDGQLFTEKGLIRPAPQKKGAKAAEMTGSCFICEKMEWGLERMLDTVYRLYETESDFRELFDSQPMFCLPHYTRLMQGCDKKSMRTHGGDFARSLSAITRRHLQELLGDVQHYCKMYDYRSAGEDADWGNARDAVERAVAFLTSRMPED